MTPHTSADVRQRLTQLRRRAWAAIGLCLLFRVGDAALHAFPVTPSHAFNPEMSQ